MLSAFRDKNKNRTESFPDDDEVGKRRFLFPADTRGKRYGRITANAAHTGNVPKQFRSRSKTAARNMGDSKLNPEQLNVDDLPEAEDHFELGKMLGSGICSNVYAAVDKESGKRH